MKRTFYFAMLLFFAAFANAQNIGFCATEEVQREFELKYPEEKQRRLTFEEELLKMNAQKFLASKGITTNTAGKYNGTVYEIPVVIHVIQSNDASLNVTDAQLQTWIDNNNKIFATTYGGSYYAEGTGPTGGTVIPFKLVLAKRSPTCTATTGVVRYNGSSISGYDAYGVKRSSNNGATVDQVRALAPHWPEEHYFNAYIITKIDSSSAYNGILGWCSYPTNSNYSYDSFMKSAVVKQPNDYVFAHEFGHGLGLIHVFEPADSNGGVCPTNANCNDDNDKVCDTAPTQSLLSVNPTPSNTTTNPCTGQNYDGVQYNFMNYTKSVRKFTPGQRDRALSVFLSLRSNLTTSLGGTPVSSGGGIGSITAASCNPTSINTSGDFNAGPTNVTFGTINNITSGYMLSTPVYYEDFTGKTCLNTTYYTSIPDNSATQLNVSFETNSQKVDVWIDYNNNGTFEITEKVASSTNSMAPGTYTYSITPPSTAVKNTYLRMRVRVDINGLRTACGAMNYGQIEDYAVKITSGSLNVTEVIKNDTSKLVYSREANSILLINKSADMKFGKYQIFDSSAKLIQSGVAEKEIRVEQELPKGTYIVAFGETRNSQKFIVN